MKLSDLEFCSFSNPTATWKHWDGGGGGGELAL